MGNDSDLVQMSNLIVNNLTKLYALKIAAYVLIKPIAYPSTALIKLRHLIVRSQSHAFCPKICVLGLSDLTQVM